ncbi:DNA repair protein RAD51 homolog 3-like isoform X2 [Hetaerina americana]|uniref:DNA repair protein RAD51 homolog 3-like isoform X2 n=1 Tax=Hetaerina americana TaxID=62018 RepID=UPI003A7F5996
MLRSVSTLPIPHSAALKLQESGFQYIEDILSSEAAKEEVRLILRHWGKDTWDSLERWNSPPKSETALEIWQTEAKLRNIITFCEVVDDVLGGGIALRRITEFCGAPGTGKTQFCLQLCVSVQIPSCFGGVSGEAIYIDADSGFSPDRLRDIAKSCAKHCEKLRKDASPNDSANIEEFSEESILNGVHYIAVNDHVELMATVSLLENFLESNEKVKLVVLDSLAFVFRYGATSFKDRTRLLYRIMSDLQNLALKFNIAVVVTNQLTTSLEVSLEGGSVSKSSLIPSLGESFAHLVGLRLILGPPPPSASCSLNGSLPLMLLVAKSCELPAASALFEVEEGGIRDAA